jgi:RNA polymerase subunit RPABC4/transcription elongation factor Spt4
MDKAIRGVLVKRSTIVCDNPACDFKRDIPFGNCEKWIDKPCPNCGENLLTREDFEKTQAVSVVIIDPRQSETEKEIVNAIYGQNPGVYEFRYVFRREPNGEHGLTMSVKKEAKK